jgi:hypothetical protein
MGTAAWGTSGLNLNAQGGNFFDTSTSASATVANTTAISSFGAAVLKANNATSSGTAVTYNHAANLYVDNVTGGTFTNLTYSSAIATNGNVSIQNGYLNIQGSNRISLGGNFGATNGQFQIYASGANVGLLSAPNSIQSNVNAGAAFVAGSNTSTSPWGNRYNQSFFPLLVGSSATINAWGTNGVAVIGGAFTYTDGTSSGAVGGVTAINSFLTSTIAATNSSTYANAATLYIGGAPSAGTNVTITNSYALYANGASYVSGALTVDGRLRVNTTAANTNTFLTIKDGHIGSTQTTDMTTSINANAGTGASVNINNATDVAGSITLVSGTLSLSAGVQFTITFNKAYAVAPIVVISPANANAESKGYVTSTTSGFSVSLGAAPVLSTTYIWTYHIIETQ